MHHYYSNVHVLMQTEMSDLLQERVVESLVALLKPADRDIPKRAEVQSADPRVTLKKMHRVCQATGSDIPSYL